MQNQINTWESAIESVHPVFNKIASSENLVTWAEESQFALQAINKNTMLAQCSAQTVQDAIVNVAAVGLTLNPTYGYAHLVPDTVKVGNNWVKVCQLRVSFKGLMKIATDSGSIKWVRAEIVKKNDKFTYNGPFERPVHEMSPFSDRGEVIGVYCVAKTSDGDYLTDIMDLNEINKIKESAKTKNVWNGWFEEMAKKAIIKRSSKQWPLTKYAERFNTAVAIVNDVEGSPEITQHKEKEVNPAAQPISVEQQQKIKDTLAEIGRTEEALCKKLNVSSISEIPTARYEGTITWLEGFKNADN